MSEPEWKNPTPRTASWGTYYYVDIRYVDGWFQQGYHRDNGPAIILNPESKLSTAYYIKGERIFQLDNKHIYGKENLAKYLLLL